MTALRRVAPLSLALSVLLAASTASASAPAAAPAAKREGVMKSLGKTVAASYRFGKADFKERRQAAGPGFIKRSMIHLGLAATTANLALKEKGAKLQAGLRATGAAFAGMKDRAMAKLAAFREARAEKRAQRAALKAANKEIESFIKTQPLDVRSALSQAKKESGVRSKIFWRNTNVAAAGANAVAAVAFVSPVNAALAPMNATAAAFGHRDLKDARQAAYTQALQYAVGKPGSSVPGDKLEAWVKAGAIKDFLK